MWPIEPTPALPWFSFAGLAFAQAMNSATLRADAFDTTASIIGVTPSFVVWNP
ncbi:hypothetical protein [Bradyrhizobium sp.]|uniref:hypothetical protein n=1 Tax=Bradyrhizobium sp. TaxID=376 RepID=UPI0025C21A3F|nr:hypothetical protein [Bradyrhizobium sp.]